MDPIQVQQMMKNTDIDNDGKIQLPEFIYMMLHPPPSDAEEVCYTLFHYMYITFIINILIKSYMYILYACGLAQCIQYIPTV